MKAREIMTSNPVTVTPTDTIALASQLMRDLNIGCVPVVENKAEPVLLGLLTDRDVTVRCVAREVPSSTKVGEAMTKAPLKTVRPEADVSEVIHKMEGAQVRRIPVVSDKGVLLGMIAQADVATKIGPREPDVIEELLERVSEPVPVTV
ncbi:MAG TPA: CBS domain-containing protein [Gemmatimonadaceae bacterium]|nr:CBS domain-containing protein [Gemmatimonadaceae bacterium]